MKIVNDTLNRLRAERLAREDALALRKLAVVMRRWRRECSLPQRTGCNKTPAALLSACWSWPGNVLCADADLICANYMLVRAEKWGW